MFQKLLAASLVALALLAAACAPDHSDADTSTRRLSANGLFEVTYEPSIDPVPVRVLHTWTVTIRSRDGVPVTDATLTIDGGMPDHGHGLPTQPTVGEVLGDGQYVIDGMKFNMGGYWVVDFAISASSGQDSVRFELSL